MEDTWRQRDPGPSNSCEETCTALMECAAHFHVRVEEWRDRDGSFPKEKEHLQIQIFKSRKPGGALLGSWRTKEMHEMWERSSHPQVHEKMSSVVRKGVSCIFLAGKGALRRA